MNERVRNNLRDIRRKARVTQEELSRAMHVSRQTIISIERGRYIPSLPLALGIARFFRRPVEEMFQLEEDN